MNQQQKKTKLPQNSGLLELPVVVPQDLLQIGVAMLELLLNQQEAVQLLPLIY